MQIRPDTLDVLSADHISERVVVRHAVRRKNVLREHFVDVQSLKRCLDFRFLCTGTREVEVKHVGIICLESAFCIYRAVNHIVETRFESRLYSCGVIDYFYGLDAVGSCNYAFEGSIDILILTYDQVVYGSHVITCSNIDYRFCIAFRIDEHS